MFLTEKLGIEMPSSSQHIRVERIIDMSYSDVYFNISGNGQLKVVDIKIDNGDLYHYFNGEMSKVLQGFTLVFEPTLVFDKYGKGCLLYTSRCV